jgi:uncharacterized repeat protein (TIGR02543 family)
MTGFPASSFGDEQVYGKVSFYQLSVATTGPNAGSTVTVPYDQLSQFMTEVGQTAVNPGEVKYLGPDTDVSQKFMGWYEFGAPDDSPYVFGTPVTGNLSLFARFASGYLVTFLDGFGDPFLTKHVALNTAVSEPTAGEMSLFTAPGDYHFDADATDGGWKLKGVPYKFAAPVTEDITLAPSLTDEVSFVYFVSEGSQVPFLTVANGTAASAPDPPEREGYGFDHWSTDPAGATAFDWSTFITTDTTLYAVWTAGQVDYTIVVWREKKDVAGDAGTDAANYEYLGKFTQKARAGSSMSGPDSPEANAAKLVSANATLKQPSWAAFGSAASTSPTVLGNGTTLLNVYYKRVVYTFSFTPYSSRYSTTTSATMQIGDTVYSDKNRYSFQAKYEQNVSAIWPVRPLAQFTIPTAGLNFQGWLPPGSTVTFVSKVISISADLLPASGTAQVIPANYITSGMDVNLHYMFESTGDTTPGAVLYNGKYYVQDATYSQQVYSPGSPFSLKEIEGMKPLTSNALQKTASGFGTVTSGKTLVDQYLFYDRIRYTISFNSMGGSAVATVQGVLPGAALASYLPVAPTRAQQGSTVWAFDGWYADSGYTAAFDFASATMPDANLIVYAKWKEDPLVVSVYDGLANASLLGSYTRAQGEYVGDPVAGLASAGISLGYVVGTSYPGKGEFLGWVIPIGPGEKAVLSPELPVNTDLSVYADWKPQLFEVSYEAGNAADGEVPVDGKKYQSGVSARVLSPDGDGSLVAPVDYKFIGWRDSSGRLHYPGEMMPVTRDVVLTASYEEAYSAVIYVYHINYPDDAQDGEGNAITDPGNLKQYVGPGQGFALLSYSAYSPTPEPVTYRFAGWATNKAEAEACVAAGMATYQPGERITALSAGSPNQDMWGVWIQSFPVIFDAGDHGTMDSGVTTVSYQIQAGKSLEDLNIAVPGVTKRDDEDTQYDFDGWALESNPSVTLNNATEIYEVPVTEATSYVAVYSGITPTGSYCTVTFDTGGVHGSIAGSPAGTSVVAYRIPVGSSLEQAGLDAVPGVTAVDSNYPWYEWALAGDSDMTPREVILTMPVTEDLSYEALYIPQTVPYVDHFYTVIFDTGGIYGEFEDGGSSSAISVKEKMTLEDTPSFTSVPAVVMKAGMNDFTFVGWSPTVDLTAPVTDVVIYHALYAYTPAGAAGAPETYYTVSFDLGTLGQYLTVPITSFLVEEGETLSSLTGLFDAANYTAANISPAPGFEFVGWYPGLLPDTPVYADRVYQALYSYEPEGTAHTDYTTLVVNGDDPGEYAIQALGYEGYYDGGPHGIRTKLGSDLELRPNSYNLQMYWKRHQSQAASPSSAAVGTGGLLGMALPAEELASGQLQLSAGETVPFAAGDYISGLPPDEVNVINEEADIVFLADGMTPGEIDLSIIIKPRPLVPTATHADMVEEDGIPLRDSYGLTMGYDDNDREGKPINDGFAFAGHEGEFALDGVPLTTTYVQGDPAGSYPIYAKAGVYGNYEIYEGTDGDWPLFPGWRLAGVVQVKAPESDLPVIDGGDGGGSNGSSADGSHAKLPATGDTVGPPLLLALLATLLTGLAAVALSLYRRKRGSGGQESVRKSRPPWSFRA